MITARYMQFVEGKLRRALPMGCEVSASDLHPMLFAFQRDVVRWAIRRGRAAIFASTGLGKTLMQLEWSRFAPKPCLILAPLAVARQTEREAKRIAIQVKLCRDANDVDLSGINVTNYDRLHLFGDIAWQSVVLDESSIIKHHTSKTLAALMSMFRDCAFKLCATATPAPNDHMELATHAEFLGLCSRQEMLSEFFVHDGGRTSQWRIKGHAKGEFWRWLASWGAFVRMPSDLGYEDDGFVLPPLNTHRHIVDPGEVHHAGLLFPMDALTLSERRNARKASLANRVARIAELVNGNERPWIVWCDLNDESAALAAALDGAREVRGSMDADEKEELLAAFGAGDLRVLVTKASIAGWGLNWQHCSDVVFAGLSDSWESQYQAIRRCWRYGQKRPVDVHVVIGSMERPVLDNIERKEAEANEMMLHASRAMADHVRHEIRGEERQQTIRQISADFPGWLA